jgi:hypothetical protein
MATSTQHKTTSRGRESPGTRLSGEDELAAEVSLGNPFSFAQNETCLSEIVNQVRVPWGTDRGPSAVPQRRSRPFHNPLQEFAGLRQYVSGCALSEQEQYINQDSLFDFTAEPQRKLSPVRAQYSIPSRASIGLLTPT